MMEDIMINIEELKKNIKTIDDAVSVALTIEQQGHNFYSEKALTSKSIAAKDLFVFLAAEEAKHIEYLNQFRETGIVPNLEGIHPREFAPSFEREFTQETPGEMDVLMGALSFEKKNEDFYRGLSAWTDDPNQREFFNRLTSFEHKHLELIDGFIDAASQFRMQT